MAETIDPKVGHNSGQIQNEAVMALHNALLPLEQEAKTLAERRRKLRQQFKSDTGISLKVFDAARTMAMIEDDDGRQQRLEAYQRVYNALSRGEQMDWFSVEEERGAEADAVDEAAGVPVAH